MSTRQRICLITMFFFLFSSFVPLYAQWARTYGESGIDSARSIQQTSDGGYIVAGETYSFGAGGSDVWVLKLSSTGTVDWQKTYGGSQDEAANSIQQTSDGGYVVAGGTESFGAGGSDIWVLKIYSGGDIDVSCGFIGSSDALGTNTSVSDEVTSVTLENTGVAPSPTSVLPQESFVVSDLLCEAPKYDLTISASTGGTTDPAPGTNSFYINIDVQVEAIPDNEYRFSEWTGDVPSGQENDNPITITMDSNKSITASFTATGDGGDEDGKGGGCFIATAAYGSSLHPYVEILRDFRDKYLMPNMLGRKFVAFYYKYSPFVADVIAQQKALKIAVQIHLLPVVVFCYSMVHFGPIITPGILLLIIGLPVFFGYSYRRK